MNNKVADAVNHLNKILPLKANQQSLPQELQELHRSIMASYIENGRSLTKSELVSKVGDPDTAIEMLKQSDMVVFNGDNEPVGTYPFTMDEREHRLKVNGKQVHCMCALDSLAVSPMYNVTVEIDSVCHVTGKPVHIVQNGLSYTTTNGSPYVHFGINWNAASENTCCADSLCTEMIFLIDEATADKWQRQDLTNRQVFTLDEAIRFAADFFVPLVN